MLNALILYRFGDARITSFVNGIVIPAAAACFRVLTIEQAPGKPGEPDFWWSVFDAASAIADAIISVELTHQTFSLNISAEQFMVDIAMSGVADQPRTSQSILLQAFGAPRAQAERLGTVHRLKIRVDTGRPRFSVRSTVGPERGLMRVTGALLAQSERDAVAQALSAMLTRVRMECAARAGAWQSAWPSIFTASRRFRYLVEHDPVIQRSVIFHAPDDDAAAAVAHKRETEIRACADYVVHDPALVADRGRSIGVLPRLPGITPETYQGLIQYHALAPFMFRNMSRALAGITRVTTNPVALKVCLTLVAAVSALVWPVYRLLLRARTRA